VDDETARWTFESAITHPDGTRVHVVITVPISATWSDVRESAEIAQMTASRAIAQIEKSKNEEVPF
jgi:hypothetical protein